MDQSDEAAQCTFFHIEVALFMTLLKAPSEIRVNEFLFGDTDYLFHSKTFFDLNASNGDVFLELETGKNRGIACYFNQSLDGKWYSPLKGTFAGPSSIGKVSDEDYMLAIGLFEQYLRSIGATEIHYLLPPLYLSPGPISFTHYLLQSCDYINYRTDLNYHVEVSDAPFEKMLSRSKRKGLGKPIMQEVTTKQLGNVDFDALYDLLHNNRKMLGAELSMKRDDLLALLSHFPDNILMVGSYFEEVLVSAAFCMKIRADTLYVFYWGNQPSCQLPNPILPVARFLYQWCQQKKISYLDLGTSTIGAESNWNLMFFKKSLGASETIKCRFKKSWK